MLKAIHHRLNKDDRGFTLIELMVVVLIIAILIAIAIPTFLGLRKRAQDRAAQSDLRNGFTAAKAFYTDNDSYGDGAAALPDFDVAAGEATEPSLVWQAAGTTPAAVNQVSIKVASGSELVLVAYSQSNTYFCLGETGVVGSAGTLKGKATTEGAVDAVADCTQGW